MALDGLQRVLVRVHFVAVVGLGVSVPLLGSTLDSVNSSGRIVIASALWTIWAGALLCTLVPSSVSLTVVRLMIPTHSATVVVAMCAAGRFDIRAGIALAMSLIALLTTFSAEIGAHFIQMSAYGDERRFPLRCPASFAVVHIAAWSLWYGISSLGLALVIAPRGFDTVVGSLLCALGAAGFAVLPKRFHQQSRRWLVAVPAGLVIHDYVVLTETTMFSRRSVTAIDTWDESSGTLDNTPLDLTGGIGSSGLVIQLEEPETVILSPTKDHPGGRAFHARSVRVCPSRVQRAIAALTVPPPTTYSPDAS